MEPLHVEAQVGEDEGGGVQRPRDGTEGLKAGGFEMPTGLRRECEMS